MFTARRVVNSSFMNLSICVSIAICLLFCCRSTRLSSPKELSIVGRWDLMDYSIDYVELSFYQDSSSIITSRSDTIFRYKYWVTNGYLALVDEFNDTTRDKIMKLTDSLLYLETLRKSEKIHRYRRIPQ